MVRLGILNCLLLSLFSSIGYGQCSGYTVHTNAVVTNPTATGASDFPGMLTGTYNFLKTTGNGGSVTSASGFDICFSDASNTTKLSWEQVAWSGTTGTVTYVIRIPSLPGSFGTVTIGCHVGNGAIVSFQGGATGAAYDTPYKAVYHLQESGSGYKDSTSNANDSTGQVAPTRVTSTIPVGFMQSFTPTQYIDFPNPLPTDTDFSVSAIINAASLGVGHPRIIWDTRGNGASKGLIMGINDDKLYCYSNNVGPANSGTTITGGTHHVACVQHTGAGVQIDGYLDGALVTTSTSGTFNGFTAGTASIGVYPGDHTSSPYDGKVQEVRTTAGVWCTASANPCDYYVIDKTAWLNNAAFITLSSPPGGGAAKRRIIQ